MFSTVCPGGLIEVGMAYQGPSQENPVAMLTSGRWNSRQGVHSVLVGKQIFCGLERCRLAHRRRKQVISSDKCGKDHSK